MKQFAKKIRKSFWDVVTYPHREKLGLQLFDAANRIGDNTAEMKNLIQQGALLNCSRAMNGNTPLHIMIDSSGKRQQEMALYLIQCGANINHINNKGESVISYAIKNKSYTVIEELMNRNVEMTPENKDDLIVLACTKWPPLFKILIEKKFDLESPLKNGDAPLLFLIKSFFADSPYTESLCYTYKNINVKDEKGRTALIIAADRGFDRAVSALLSLGCDYQIVDNKGVDALSAAHRSYTSVANDSYRKVIVMLEEEPMRRQKTEDDRIEKIVNASTTLQNPLVLSKVIKIKNGKRGHV